MTSFGSGCGPPPSSSVGRLGSATIWGMTGTSQSSSARTVVGSSSGVPAGSEAAPTTVRLLLHSDNITTRDAVRAAVGRRPARDVEVESWRECATPAAVVEAVEQGDIDLVILDGEAAKTGGLGLCRQLKVEVLNCPPVLVLTGRPQDGWLATWSMADGSVPHPLDPIAVADAVATLARGVGGR